MVPVIDRVYDPTSGCADDLVSEGDQLGARFVRRLVEEWTDGTNRFDRPGEALFGAWIDGRLVGVCGLNIDPYAGDERVGRVRHLYVLSGFRGSGVGRRLVTHVITAAHGRFDALRLRTNNSVAARLYETLGFLSCAGHADHTHVRKERG
jgi:GNAT superfamily N-acetyltransferase